MRRGCQKHPAGWRRRYGSGSPIGLVRPALRAGFEYNDDDAISHTVGASLTFGRRYGARFIVDRWSVSGASLVLLQVGGYVSF